MWKVIVFISIILFIFFLKGNGGEPYTPLFSAHFYPKTDGSIWNYQQMSDLPYFPPVGPYTIGWRESIQNKIEYPTQTRIYNYLYPS